MRPEAAADEYNRDRNDAPSVTWHAATGLVLHLSCLRPHLIVNNFWLPEKKHNSFQWPPPGLFECGFYENFERLTRMAAGRESEAECLSWSMNNQRSQHQAREGAAWDSAEGSPRSPVARVLSTRRHAVVAARGAAPARKTSEPTERLDEMNISLVDHGAACLKMGRTYEQLGRLDEAIEMLTQHLVIAKRCVDTSVPGRAPISSCARRTPDAPTERVMWGCAGWVTWRARALLAVPSGLCN